MSKCQDSKRRTTSFVACTIRCCRMGNIHKSEYHSKKNHFSTFLLVRHYFNRPYDILRRYYSCVWMIINAYDSTCLAWRFIIELVTNGLCFESTFVVTLWNRHARRRFRLNLEFWTVWSSVFDNTPQNRIDSKRSFCWYKIITRIFY